MLITLAFVGLNCSKNASTSSSSSLNYCFLAIWRDDSAAEDAPEVEAGTEAMIAVDDAPALAPGTLEVVDFRILFCKSQLMFVFIESIS